MIGFLKGRVIEASLREMLVDVGGVGYRVFVVVSGIKYQVSSDVKLWIHTYVREDQISLYGFGDKKQLKMFELLISVSGVGPKVAMGILGQTKVEKIQEAVAKADVSFFTAIKGLGKKGAQKIIIELKNKLGSVEELDLGDDGGDEVAAGLVGMGFEVERVRRVLREIEPGLAEEQKIKVAIRALSK